jgi:hypothetical protein
MSRGSLNQCFVSVSETANRRLRKVRLRRQQTCRLGHRLRCLRRDRPARRQALQHAQFRSRRGGRSSTRSKKAQSMMKKNDSGMNMREYIQLCAGAHTSLGEGLTKESQQLGVFGELGRRFRFQPCYNCCFLSSYNSLPPFQAGWVFCLPRMHGNAVRERGVCIFWKCLKWP